MKINIFNPECFIKRKNSILKFPCAGFRINCATHWAVTQRGDIDFQLYTHSKVNFLMALPRLRLNDKAQAEAYLNWFFLLASCPNSGRLGVLCLTSPRWFDSWREILRWNINCMLLPYIVHFPIKTFHSLARLFFRKHGSTVKRWFMVLLLQSCISLFSAQMKLEMFIFYDGIIQKGGQSFWKRAASTSRNSSEHPNCPIFQTETKLNLWERIEEFISK